MFVLTVEVMTRYMPTGTIDEREAKWKECLLSIGKKCQVLRSGRALKEDLLNPSNSFSDAETLPFSNANEGNAAAQSISTPSATMKVNETENGDQTPVQVNLGVYSFYCYFSCVCSME